MASTLSREIKTGKRSGNGGIATKNCDGAGEIVDMQQTWHSAISASTPALVKRPSVFFIV